MTALAWPLAILGLLLAFVLLVAMFVTVIFVAHQVFPRMVPDPKEIITAIGELLSSAGSFVARVLRRTSVLATDKPTEKGKDSPEAPPNGATGRSADPLSETATPQTAASGDEQPTAV